MADVTITREQWDNAVRLFEKYGYRPTVVSRKTGIPFDVIKTLYEEGFDNGFPPIEPIIKARREAKKAKNPPHYLSIEEPETAKLHVGDKSIPPHIAAGTHSHTPTIVASAPAPTPLPAPQPAPDVSTSLETRDPAAALASALETVHRGLAQALLRENTLVHGLREQAIGLAAGASDGVRAYQAVIKRVTANILKAAERDEIEERRGFTLITRLMKITKVAAEQALAVMELERLLVGLPQSITGTVEPRPGADATADLAAITARLEALQSTRRNRVIDVDVVPYQGEESGGD